MIPVRSRNTVLAVRPDNIDGLIGWWPLSTNAADDLIGNSPNRIQNGNPVPIWGPMGGGQTLSSGNYWDMGNVLDFTTNYAMTMACWFKTSRDGSGLDVLFGKFNNSNPFNGYELRLGAGPVFVFDQANTGAGAANIMSVQTDIISSISSDYWQHFVAAASSSGTVAGVSLYLNGVSINVNLLTDNLNASISSNVSFQIGGRNGNNLPFTGSLADVRLYNRKLSTQEVSEIYNQGFAVLQNEEFPLFGGPTAAQIYAFDQMGAHITRKIRNIGY